MITTHKPKLTLDIGIVDIFGCAIEGNRTISYTHEHVIWFEFDICVPKWRETKINQNDVAFALEPNGEPKRHISILAISYGIRERKNDSCVPLIALTHDTKTTQTSVRCANASVLIILCTVINYLAFTRFEAIEAFDVSLQFSIPVPDVFVYYYYYFISQVFCFHTLKRAHFPSLPWTPRDRSKIH